MSGFKNISPSDIIVSPYVANKQWGFNYLDYLDNGILIYSGKKDSTDQTEKSVYNIVNHLYYQSFSGSRLDSGSLMRSFSYQDAEGSTKPSGSYYDYSDKTFTLKTFPSQSGSEIRVISIPCDLYGSKIKPGTFYMSCSQYICTDDKMGNIINTFTSESLGNIYYSHGLAVLSGSVNLTGSRLEFKNEHVIYEKTIKCSIKDYEFNYTYNPSTFNSSGSSEVKSFISGSDFQPYITTVGLYNEWNQLVMVAKLGQPLPMPDKTDLNILIKIDV